MHERPSALRGRVPSRSDGEGHARGRVAAGSRQTPRTRVTPVRFAGSRYCQLCKTITPCGATRVAPRWACCAAGCPGAPLKAVESDVSLPLFSLAKFERRDARRAMRHLGIRVGETQDAAARTLPSPRCLPQEQQLSSASGAGEKRQEKQNKKGLMKKKKKKRGTILLPRGTHYANKVAGR